MRLKPFLFFILLATLFLFSFWASLSLNTNHPLGAADYRYYFRGATRILEGTPLYENIDASSYVGPPLVIQMVLPLVALSGGDFRVSATLWFALNSIALVLSFVMIALILPLLRKSWIFWCGVALSMPIIYSLWGGQVTPLMFLFTVGAWFSYHRGYKIAAGVLLAVIVWTKFYPGLLLVYFLWKREWRVVAGGAVGTIVIIIFQMMLVGFDGFVQFFRDVLPPLMVNGQPALNHSNNSVLGFAQRLFSPSPHIEMLVESPVMVGVTRYGLTALLLLSVFALSIQPMNKTTLKRFDLEYALTLLVALLLGSTLGVHGMLSAFLPIVILIEHTPKTARRVVSLGILVAYLLINLHIFIIVGYLVPGSENRMPALMLSMPFFGMMVLWGMLVNAHLNSSKQYTPQVLEKSDSLAAM